MDIQPTEQKTQSISDDQELAKVLAGINTNDEDETATPEPAVAPTPPPVVPSDPAAPAEPDFIATEPVAPTPVTPAPDPVMPTSVGSDLESIKQEALGELRPLVDKLNVSPEEKFDTYLLLLRSTDDRDLIAPAHAAAKNITDEARKAQALLDIIKEIDFLSNPQQAQE